MNPSAGDTSSSSQDAEVAVEAGAIADLSNFLRQKPVGKQAGTRTRCKRSQMEKTSHHSCQELRSPSFQAFRINGGGVISSIPQTRNASREHHPNVDNFKTIGEDEAGQANAMASAISTSPSRGAVDARPLQPTPHVLAFLQNLRRFEDADRRIGQEEREERENGGTVRQSEGPRDAEGVPKGCEFVTPPPRHESKSEKATARGGAPRVRSEPGRAAAKIHNVRCYIS
jgi:hypothetical protein